MHAFKDKLTQKFSDLFPTNSPPTTSSSSSSSQVTFSQLNLPFYDLCLVIVSSVYYFQELKKEACKALFVLDLIGAKI
jgi:hypothetical protein